MYEKVKVSTGQLKRNTRLNLGGFHITSMDFCHNKVVDCKLMMPGDKVSLKLAHNLQMTPPVGFTIGKCNLQFKSFFVPARLCNQHFENFIENRETYTLGSTTSAHLPVSYNHILCAYLVQNFGFLSPVHTEHVNPNTSGVDSPWSGSTNEPLYMNPLGTGFNPKFALVEPIGVCNSISEDGKPVGVLKFVNSTVSDHLNGSKQGISLVSDGSDNWYFNAYDGKDYDFVSPFMHIDDSDSEHKNIYFDLYGFQFNPMVFDNGDTSSIGNLTNSLAVYPYVLFRFTELGKRYYDLFLSCGYSLNWSSLLFQKNFLYSHLNELSDFHRQAYSAKDYDSPFIHEMNLPKAGDGTSSTMIDFFNDDLSYVLDGSLHGATEDVIDSWTQRNWYDDVTSRMSIKFTPSHFSDIDSFVSLNSAIDTTRFNMMKISGLLKIFVDYLCPSYYSRDFMSLTFNIFADPNMVYTTETFDILRYFLISVYDKDYFSSSWQYPNSPTALTPLINNPDIGDTFGGGVRGNGDVNSHSTEINSDQYGSFLVDDNNVLSKIGMDALNALHKLFRIKGLAGSRYIDQLFARFGQKNSNARLQRSEFVGVMRSNFDVQLVMSNSDTDGAALGDYVSHGESRNKGSLGSYDVTEWGYLYIIASIVPLPMYYQGRDRENLYNAPLDFFTPELDAIDSMQAIRQDELIADNNICTEFFNSRTKYVPYGTFGYTRLWSEMKKGVDRMTGDFRLLSHGKYSNDCYHLFRMMPTLSEIVGRGLNLQSSLEFNYAHDKAQFDRIFQNTDSTFDHFMLFMSVDIFVTRNCKSMTDFSFDDECDTIDREIKNGGTEMN